MTIAHIAAHQMIAPDTLRHMARLEPRTHLDSIQAQHSTVPVRRMQSPEFSHQKSSSSTGSQTLLALDAFCLFCTAGGCPIRYVTSPPILGPAVRLEVAPWKREHACGRLTHIKRPGGALLSCKCCCCDGQPTLSRGMRRSPEPCFKNTLPAVC